MGREEDSSERLVLAGENMHFELPLDLSQWIREEAARLGTTPAVLVNQVLAEKLRQLGYDPGPPVDQASTAISTHESRTQSSEGDAVA